ncbi:T6SS amidase immunity protein Tai4 family protein [Roseateles chitinivorans]|uniref:T6SS amidase immunity protein Tai4 family protein n=1 Tax=Roseateles chitinivorans TaxID=2917965 RepID=UPI003D67491F
MKAQLIGLAGLAFLSPVAWAQAAPPGPGQPTISATPSYSQQTLLKNWATSVCLATVARSPEAKDDANATASAYMEFGKQPLAAYAPLRDLAVSFAKRTYAGASPSEFNTMKCIDLMHSKELDALTARLANSAK